MAGQIAKGIAPEQVAVAIANAAEHHKPATPLRRAGERQAAV
jgi:hypothetical protein